MTVCKRSFLQPALFLFAWGYANKSVEAPRISRSQKSAEAIKEVSSLARRSPRGIDARALGAAPPSGPPALKITRVVTGLEEGSGFAPRGRTGFRGAHGGARGRGMQRGRGSGRGRGARGRGRRGGGTQKKATRQQVDEDDWIEEPYSEEELAYQEMSDGGFPTNYVPETSEAILAGYGPAVMSSPRGIHESVVNRIMVATDHKDPSYEHASIHLARMDEGLGTFFEDAEQRAITEKFQGSRKFKSLSEKQRGSIMRQWVAGHYAAPGTPAQGSVLALARQMAQRNETYLPDDRLKFEMALRKVLPNHMQTVVFEKPSTRIASSTV